MLVLVTHTILQNDRAIGVVIRGYLVLTSADIESHQVEKNGLFVQFSCCHADVISPSGRFIGPSVTWETFK